MQNLGGHDLQVLEEAYRACGRRDRPTQRGVRLHREGLGAADGRRPAEPRRAAVPRAGRRLPRARSGSTSERRVGPVRARDSAEGAAVRVRRRRPEQPAGAAPAPAADPAARSASSTASPSPRRRRSAACSPGSATRPEVAARLVTTSPDVSVSTNLGGWINKMGVFSPHEQQDFLGDRAPPALAAGPDRTAHRAGHQRDEPVPHAPRARPRPRAPRRAPAADRHGLRPLRLPWARRAHLRALQRRPLRGGRDAVRHHAGARGRRAPVDHHRLDRDGAARA